MALAADAAVQRRYSPFWTSLPDCQTTIRLHNNLVSEPLTVLPILYLEDGTPLELEPIEMEALGSASIDVNRTVRELGHSTPRFGGAEFAYERDLRLRT